jgi:hypothetical protein
MIEAGGERAEEPTEGETDYRFCLVGFAVAVGLDAGLLRNDRPTAAKLEPCGLARPAICGLQRARHL